jgi:hypothetical protein
LIIESFGEKLTSCVTDIASGDFDSKYYTLAINLFNSFHHFISAIALQPRRTRSSDEMIVFHEHRIVKRDGPVERHRHSRLKRIEFSHRYCQNFHQF